MQSLSRFVFILLLRCLTCSQEFYIYEQGKGLFELVDYYFASAFQTLYDEFVQNVCNFIQVGRYHRFWTDLDGKLNVMVVTPQQTSIHPEWRELFDQTSQTIQQQFLNMRHLGRRVGYFITDIRKGRFFCSELKVSACFPTNSECKQSEENSGEDLEKIHTRERGSKGKVPDRVGSAGNGDDAHSSGSGELPYCSSRNSEGAHQVKPTR